MTKGVVAVVLVLGLMAFVLSACGGSDSKTDAEEKPPASKQISKEKLPASKQISIKTAPNGGCAPKALKALGYNVNGNFYGSLRITFINTQSGPRLLVMKKVIGKNKLAHLGQMAVVEGKHTTTTNLQGAIEGTYRYYCVKPGERASKNGGTLTVAAPSGN